MEIITEEILKELTKEEAGFCLTIVMNTSPIAVSNIKNPALFRDMISGAKERLKESSMGFSNIENFIEPLKSLSNDDFFWKDQFATLIVYVNNAGLKTIKLPTILEEKIVVSHFNYILPIYQYLNSNQSYYCLLLNKGGCRLFLSDRYQTKEITPVEIEMTEKSFTDFTELSEDELFYSGAEGARQKNHENVMYYGHGNTKDDMKLRASQYIASIEKEVKKALFRSNLPLVLLGSGHGYLTSMYREKNSYDFLTAKDIIISKKTLSKKELREKTWPEIEKILENRIKLEVESYFDKKSTNLISNQTKEIILSSRFGQLETLFVNLDKESFGIFEMLNETAMISETNDQKDESFSNLAIYFSARNSGKIITLPDKMMPESTPLNAIFRY